MSEQSIDQQCAKGIAVFTQTTGQYTCSGCGKVLQRSPADHAAAAQRRLEASYRVPGKAKP